MSQATVLALFDHGTDGLPGAGGRAPWDPIGAVVAIPQGVRTGHGGLGSASYRSWNRVKTMIATMWLTPFSLRSATLAWPRRRCSSITPERNGGIARFLPTHKEQFLWIRDWQSSEALNERLEQGRQLPDEHALTQRHGHRSAANGRRAPDSAGNAA
jgi:hypothetical protein